MSRRTSLISRDKPRQAAGQVRPRKNRVDSQVQSCCWRSRVSLRKPEARSSSRMCVKTDDWCGAWPWRSTAFHPKALPRRLPCPSPAPFPVPVLQQMPFTGGKRSSRSCGAHQWSHTPSSFRPPHQPTHRQTTTGTTQRPDRGTQRPCTAERLPCCLCRAERGYQSSVQGTRIPFQPFSMPFQRHFKAIIFEGDRAAV